MACTESSAAWYAASATLYFVSAICSVSVDVIPRVPSTFARSYAAFASSRFAVAVRTVAVSSSAGTGCLVSTGPRMPSCDRVCSSEASRPFEGEGQFPRLELDERRADVHLAADFDQDLADDARRLRADLRRVGRQQRAGQVNLALDGHAQDGRRL